MSTLWQQPMIGLAISERTSALVQRHRWTRGLAGRFAGGPDVSAAIATATALRAEGLSTSHAVRALGS